MPLKEAGTLVAVRDDNFFVVHGWMINKLGLKGSELQLFAIIYGFSQAEGQNFHGGLQYLSDWTNIAKRNVIARLQSLVDKGLLVKTDVYTNGVKSCEYRCVINPPCGDVSSPGVVMKHHRGGDETSPNNIKDNISDIDIDNTEGEAPTPPLVPLDTPKRKSVKLSAPEIEAMLARYAPNAEALELLREWVKVRKAKRAPETEKALTLNLDKLDGLARESGLTVNGYLEAVIARGWAAFYTIKDGRPAGGGYQRPQPERSRIKSEADYAAGLQGWG